MMEEINNILPTGGDALVYLAELMHKNIPQRLFGAIHLVLTYLLTEFWTPRPPVRTWKRFGWTPPFPQLRTYLMDSLFLNQKINKNIRILYSLKYKYSKNNSLRKNKL